MENSKKPTETTGSFRSWAMVAVLTLLLMLAMVDRLALSLVVAPLRRDLHLTDLQLSPLLGPSFALFYTLVGLPAGYLVDRANRRNLILAGALIWTGTTALSAFAPSFGWLFVCRAGVGVGEAILSPAIYSMIRDSFPYRQRALAYGLNNLGSPLGTGAALMTVGSLSAAASHGAFGHWPVLAGLGDWRTILAIIGLGGLPISLLVLTIREPARQTRSTDDATLGAVAARLHQFPKAYVALFLGTACYAIGLNGLLSWGPTAVARALALPIGIIAPRMGLYQVIAAPIGLLSAGVTFTVATRRGFDLAIPLLGSGAMLLSAATIGLWPYQHDATAMWSLYLLLSFLMPWNGVTIATLLAHITPDRMMGKIAAINFLMLGLVGMVAGPVLIPLLATLFSGPTASLQATGLNGGVALAMSSMALMIFAVDSRRKRVNAD